MDTLAPAHRRPGGAGVALPREPPPHRRPLRADRARGVRRRADPAAPPVRFLRRAHPGILVHHAGARRAAAAVGRRGARAASSTAASTRATRPSRHSTSAAPGPIARAVANVSPRRATRRSSTPTRAPRLDDPAQPEPRARRGGVQHPRARGDASRDADVHHPPAGARATARPALRAPRRRAAAARSGRDPGRPRDARRATRRDRVRLGQRVRRARRSTSARSGSTRTT